MEILMTRQTMEPNIQCWQ